MIGKVTRGTGVGGLLRYLYGPGRHNEHTDPHLVAGWDEPAALEPAVDGEGRALPGALAQLLGQPLKAAVGAVEAKAVWQCSLRSAPGDRRLSDEEWASIARDVVDRCGFAPAGDEDGCRWVAVRHAEDHIHLVVTLARQDGRAVHPRNDFYRVGEACRAAEQRLGLRLTAGRDRTAGSAATYGESEKAKRQGLPEPVRDTLRRHVRTAAAGASSGPQFLERLRDAGLMVQERFSEQHPGEITGYKVALPAAALRTKSGEPVWYGGAKLAADLSWPKLQRRWSSPAGHTAGPAEPGVRLDAEARAAVWSKAQAVTQQAASEIRRLAGTDPAAASDAAWAASDALSVAAKIVEGVNGGQLTRAADLYDRAAREMWGRTPTVTPTGSALRGVARMLTLTGRARRDEAAQLIALLTNLMAMTQAVARLRDTQNRAAQAAAARAAAEQLQHQLEHRRTAGTRTPLSTASHAQGVQPTTPSREPHRRR